MAQRAGLPRLYAIDTTAWPRPNAPTSPDRQPQYTPGGPRGAAMITTGWRYQHVVRLTGTPDSWVVPVLVCLGVGCAVAQALRDAGVLTPLRDFGIPAEFLDHANRGEVLEQIGLTGQRIAHEVVGLVAGLGSAAAVHGSSSNGSSSNGSSPNGSSPKVTTR